METTVVVFFFYLSVYSMRLVASCSSIKIANMRRDRRWRSTRPPGRRRHLPPTPQDREPDESGRRHGHTPRRLCTHRSCRHRIRCRSGTRTATGVAVPGSTSQEVCAGRLAPVHKPIRHCVQGMHVPGVLIDARPCGLLGNKVANLFADHFLFSMRAGCLSRRLMTIS